jgi:hypothetical protein
MANAEFETKWAAAPTSTSPNGATATLLLLIAALQHRSCPTTLSVGKIKTGTPASAERVGSCGTDTLGLEFYLYLR